MALHELRENGQIPHWMIDGETADSVSDREIQSLRDNDAKCENAQNRMGIKFIVMGAVLCQEWARASYV